MSQYVIAFASVRLELVEHVSAIVRIWPHLKRCVSLAISIYCRIRVIEGVIVLGAISSKFLWV